MQTGFGSGTICAPRVSLVDGYSSAVFCFAPDIALAFYHAYRNVELPLVHALLDRFYRPLVELRRQGAGYAVSLVKAAVGFEGLDAGPVRAPLAEPAPEHVAALAELVAEGRRVLKEFRVADLSAGAAA